MKTKNLFLVIVAIVTATLVGCAHTPKVVRVNTVQGQNLKYGQPPAQRIIEDGGRQYDQHVRILQGQRLAHERAMAQMDYQAEEIRFAKEKGVAVPQAPQQAAFVPPGQGYYVNSTQPSVVVTQPSVAYYQPQAYIQVTEPRYYPATVSQYYGDVVYGGGGLVYGGGAYYEQRKLFGVRYRAAVNPAYQSSPRAYVNVHSGHVGGPRQAVINVAPGQQIVRPSATISVVPSQPSQRSATIVTQPSPVVNRPQATIVVTGGGQRRRP